THDINDYSLFDKFRTELETMAQTKDQSCNNYTPFQVASERIKEYVRTNEKLSDKLHRFVLFLYGDCKSNPNEPMLIENVNKEAQSVDYEDEEDNENVSNKRDTKNNT